MKRFEISYFKSVKAKEKFRADDITLTNLYDILDTPFRCSKDRAPLFIAGETRLIDGKRAAISRSMAVLDADHPREDFLSRAEELFINSDFGSCITWCYYTTASATEAEPRYRIVIPLSEPIRDAEAYRKICSILMACIAPDDITAAPADREFDWSSAEFSRLMYMPTKQNSFYDFGLHVGCSLSVSAITKFFDYYSGSAVFTVHGDKSQSSKKSVGERKSRTCSSGGSFSACEAAQNPAEKDSIIGSFCKVFDVESAILEYDLPYTQVGDRWLYDGSTSGIPGVSISDCGQFLLSVHESDPAGGRLQNSFDLVRIHRGLTDKEMYRLAMQNPEVKAIEVERARAYKQKHHNR